MADDCKGGGFGCVFLSFIMGAAIGGGLALLAAPRSGQETRERMRDMADDVRERVRKVAEEAEERIKATIEEGKGAIEERKDIIRSAVEAGREAMEAERAKHKKAGPESEPA